MIKEPYKDIPEKYASVVKSLLSASDEYHRVHARRMARTLQTFAESNPTGKLLEVGTSHLIPLAIKELELDVEVSVTDFDLSKPYSGKMECSLNNKTVEVDVYRVNIEESTIPVPDETFDVVLLCEVLEHMEVDPMFMLSEINRITKQGGKLILTTPNSTSSRNIHKILNGYEPYFYMQYRHDRSLYRHNYEYSLPTLKSVMRSAGFEGKFWTEDSFEDGIISIPLQMQMLGYKMEHVGDNIFGVLQKTRGVIDRYPKEIYVD
jgi:2-polyprenyl-3-methyl-5-hydroxy-6-metoxy-1,4-benzoquinol methylase